MAVKHYKPTSPSRRGMSGVHYRSALSGDKPLKSLVKGFRRGSGRNSDGRITTRHKGGGHKRRFRDVDFAYAKKDIRAKIETLEYDPNRSSFIARVVYADGARRYVIAPGSAKIGDTFIVSEKADVAPGNRLPLRLVPVGTFVYNVEVKPESGAKLARSAGNYAEVLSNDAGYTNLKMPSGEVRKISEKAWASIGAVSNPEHNLANLGKAGRSRWRGIRPTVRGSAMNPVDHPYGGGEGRSGRGRRRAVSAWGKPTGGVKTRRRKKYSSIFIVSRRKSARDKKRV